MENYLNATSEKPSSTHVMNHQTQPKLSILNVTLQLLKCGLPACVYNNEIGE